MEEKCYLEKQDIPPLSELDHINRSCYCYLCTCGKHSCPSLSNYQRRSPKMISSYRDKFARRHHSPPPKPFLQMNEIIISKQKMDLKSTNQEDFKEYFVESPRKKINDIRYRSVSPFRFNGNSTYTKNYISYGPLEKSPVFKANSEYIPVKFIGTSTYAEQYIKHGKVAKNFEKHSKSKNILGAGGISILETTNHSTYKDFKEKFWSKPILKTPIETRIIGNSSPVIT